MHERLWQLGMVWIGWGYRRQRYGGIWHYGADSVLHDERDGCRWREHGTGDGGRNGRGDGDWSTDESWRSGVNGSGIQWSSNGAEH